MITPAKQSAFNRFGTGRDWIADYPDKLEREHAKILTIKNILCQLAYPRRGTTEEYADRQYLADLTKSFFSAEDLE